MAKNKHGKACDVRYQVVDITGNAVACFYTPQIALGYILCNGGPSLYHIRPLYLPI